MLEDERGVYAEGVPDLQCVQVAFERVAQKDRMWCDERGWGRDEGCLDGGERVCGSGEALGCDARPPWGVSAKQMDGAGETYWVR